jgi:hypothetical protein
MLERASSKLTDPSKVNRRFSVSEEHVGIKQVASRPLLAACFALVSGFLLGLLFGPEDEGYNFLRHVG